jgi:hexosaminidase
MSRLFQFTILVLFLGSATAGGTRLLAGGTASPLFERGYNVIPAPQQVKLTGPDFQFGPGWRLVLRANVNAADVAVEALRDGLSERDSIPLTTSAQAGGKTIELIIKPGSVQIGEAEDKNKAALERQAYAIDLGTNEIRIRANSLVGLFYGVETLVQLVKREDGKLWLPTGTITDWPDLEQRNIYWDDSHHLEHPDVLKRAMRQAAFYKINGFVIKLDGHFQYQSAPAVVDPYALSPAQLQDLTNYGLRYHIQLIPYLDSPAHIVFILKHPEYAGLREFPDSNYELCTTNPASVKLIEGMYHDLLDANKGVKEFYLSTDEPYFVGLADNSQCHSAEREKQLGTVGKVLADFVTQLGNYLHDRGRQVVFWGEFPLVPSDIPSLPSYLINGEIYGQEFDEAFKARGIRQMIFTSTVGWQELLFPNYYIRPATEMLPGPEDGAYKPATPGPGIISDMFNLISYTPERNYADLMGTVVAGWGDVGLNPETMWLGYITGSAPAWHPGAENPRELMASFYKLFYGRGAGDMGRIYQLMSEQAQFYQNSWNAVASNARKGIWGDYAPVIYKPRRPAEDQTLPLPPVPGGDLLNRVHGWAHVNARRLALASVFLSQNDELMDLLNRDLQSVQFNRYNLEVYLSIAWLYRQNLEMLLDLQQINTLLNSAQKAAAQADVKQSIASVDEALDLAQQIRTERNRTYADAVQTWYETWFPRVAEANGRRYLFAVDDVKDHLPMRTVDMSYLIYRELLLPLGGWYREVEAARNQYAKAYGLPARTDTFMWKDYKSVVN